MTLKEFRGDILDVHTLAKLMNVCPMTIYRHMKRKDPLPGYRVGGKFLFFREQVEKWIRARE